MAITTNIFRTYREPRTVIRSLLAAGQREDRAIAYLMGGCLLAFVAQWPLAARNVQLNPEGPPLEAQIGGALMGWLFIAPLVFYAIAALSHLMARAVGGQGSHYTARIALFWTFLATAPIFLLNGLVAGFIGPGPQLTVTGLVWVVAFFVLWGISLLEAERPEAA